MAEGAIGTRGAAILERDGEKQALEELGMRAAQGSGGATVFEGPAGIGKSSLLELTELIAEGEGMRALTGRGLPIESTFPFGVVRQLFEPVLAASTPARRRALFGGAAELARPIFEPSAAQSAGTEEAGAVRHGLFWLAANIAANQPLCLLIDDAHWADPPTLAWLVHLANRISELPAMVAIAVRTEDPGARAPALLEIGGLPHVLTMRPRTLSVNATAVMVRESLGADVSDAACDACHAATGGNPLLTRELVHALKDEGVGEDLRPEEIAEFGPGRIAAAVERRLARLPAATLDLARAIAVLGDDVDIPEAAALAELDEAKAEEAADSLVTVGVLDPGRQLRFVHPIVRAAIEDAIPPGSRAALHRRAIAVLREGEAEAERVAAHLLALGAGSEPDAIDWLWAAAKAAVARGAPDLATVQLRRALAEKADEATRADLLHALGLAEMANREPDAVTHLREAVDLAPERDRPQYALRAARPIGLSGDHAGAVALCSLGLAGSPSTTERQQLEAELILNRTTAAHLGAGTEHPPIGEDGDGHVSPELAVARGYVSCLRGEPLEPLVDTAEALLPGLRDGEAGLPLTAALLQLGWADRLGSVLELATEFVNTGRELGSPNLVIHYETFRGFAMYRAGRLAEAEADLWDVVDFNLADPSAQAISWPLAWLLEVAAAREVEGDLSGVQEKVADLGDWFGSALLVEARGTHALARDRPEEAIEHFADCANRWRELGVQGPPVAGWRVGQALALAQTRESQQAAALADEHAELARRCGSNRELGRALHAAAIARGGPEGIALLRESVSVLADSPAQLDLARAHAALGEGLRRAGDRSDARGPLRTALDLAERSGATALSERIRDSLRAAGGRPRTPYLTGAEALTASERRTAVLAAGGRTNREIAAALFVSQNTVETHLRAVFRKLDIRSRAEIAAKLD